METTRNALRLPTIFYTASPLFKLPLVERAISGTNHGSKGRGTLPPLHSTAIGRLAVRVIPLLCIISALVGCDNPVTSDPGSIPPPPPGGKSEEGTELSIDTSVIDFGMRLPLGYDYVTRIVHVKNTGDRAITINTSFTGEGSGQFRPERPFPSQIPARGSTDLRVMFQPPREGKRILRATLCILEVENAAATEIPLVARTSAGLPDQSVIYVDQDATGEDDGTSWDDAFPSLAHVINLVDQYQAKGKQIWVAEGRYTQDKGFGIQFPNAFYGGFAGDETRLEDRDPHVHRTIMDGNGRATHTLRIVPQSIGDHVARDLVVDGFDVTGGRAVGTSLISGNNAGGGVFVGKYRYRETTTYTRVIINGCRIYGNESAIRGAAIWNGHEPLVISNTLITGNTGAVSIGYNEDKEIDRLFGTKFAKGAIVSLGGSSGSIDKGVFVTNCTIAGNAQGPRAYGTPNPIQITPDVVMRNTIVYGDHDGLELLGEKPVDISHCILNSVPDSAHIVGGSLIGTLYTEDPLLTEIGERDYSRRTAAFDGSRARNAGDNDAVETWMTRALNGSARILGGTVDIGAAEGSS